MFRDVSHNDPSHAFHVVPLDDAIKDDGESVSLLHHVNVFRSVHVFPAPCVEQPRGRVTDGRPDLCDLARLQGDHDVSKPPDHGNSRDIQSHVTHLYANVRRDFRRLTSEVLAGT